MQINDANTVHHGEQRVACGLRQLNAGIKERHGLRHHALHGIGGDEPGLAGEKGIERGHAPVGVSTTGG